MSNSAWCDLNINVDILNLHDYCHSPKCKCHNQITFHPRQLQMEGASFEKNYKTFLKRAKQLGIFFQSQQLTQQLPLLEKFWLQNQKFPW